MEMNERLKKALSFTIILALCFTLMAAFSTTEAQAAGKTHLKKTSITLTIGATYQQKLLTASGKTISASKVKWSSSNSKIAKISKTGKITAIKKGTVKLKAKYKGKSYTCKVKVINGIKIAQDKVKLNSIGSEKSVWITKMKDCGIATYAEVVEGSGVVSIEFGESYDLEAAPKWEQVELKIRGVKNGTAKIKVLAEDEGNYKEVAKNCAYIQVTVDNEKIGFTKIKNTFIEKKSDTFIKERQGYTWKIKWLKSTNSILMTMDNGKGVKSSLLLEDCSPNNALYTFTDTQTNGEKCVVDGILKPDGTVEVQNVTNTSNSTGTNLKQYATEVETSLHEWGKMLNSFRTSWNELGFII